MSKHTPGPWLTEPSVRGFEITANDVRIGEARDEANARLMAAAPELFYVAQRVVQDWDHSLNPSRGTDLLKAARAAINSATKEEA